MREEIRRKIPSKGFGVEAGVLLDELVIAKWR
jgi:hypothetical protein